MAFAPGPDLKWPPPASLELRAAGKSVRLDRPMAAKVWVKEKLIAQMQRPCPGSVGGWFSPRLPPRSQRLRE